MQQDSASFWTDIKYYEERLAQDPDSYLFARLSEVYLKVHLIDDALHTARQGVAKYPTYISGQRALAMACYAKGLYDESRTAMEMVASALPEDVEVQKLLGKLLVSHGSLEAARKAFRTALEFSPDDDECRDELKTLLQGASDPLTAVALQEEDDDIIELQESDIIDEEETIGATPQYHDPLSTATLAELYVQQGFFSKALDIYRSVLVDDPGNGTIKSRISELEAKIAASSVDLSAPVSADSLQNLAYQERETSSAPEPDRREAVTVLSTLEGWLDNIRRIKACR